MKAVVLVETGGPDSLELVDTQEPAASAGDVLVDVHAAGVAYPDLLYSRGLYQERPALPCVLGREAAGVVREAPLESGLRAGDRVAVFLPGLGGFAETIAVPVPWVLPIPGYLSFEEGACLPVNYLTAYFALSHRAHLLAGQHVLVHGATGGVGSAAIQVARAMGARTTAVVSTAAKAEVASRLGADRVVLVADFLSEVRAAALGRVDVVLDPVGGDRFDDSLRALARYGKLLVVGFAGGVIPSVKVNKLLLSNTEVIGVGWGGPAAEPGFVAEQWAELQPILGAEDCRPLIHDALPLSRAREALHLLEQRKVVGKVVLTVRG